MSAAAPAPPSARRPDARAAWHRLLQVSSRVLREIDAALDRRERMSVTEFDVLITLDNAPDKRLRMTHLAQATMLSSGGMTRLVGRLEDRGLVRRDPDPQDARAFLAGLTPAGQAKLEQARIAHDAVIADVVATHLTTSDVHDLESLLDKVLESRAP